MFCHLLLREKTINLYKELLYRAMPPQSFLSQTKTSRSRMLRTHSFSNAARYIHQDESPSKSTKQGENIAAAQEVIWKFFLNLTKSNAPELVLKEFKNLFINPTYSSNSEIQKALNTIVFSQNEQEFRNTLKRCIYILLNTWIIGRKYQYPQALIEKFAVTNLNYRDSSTFLDCLRSWIINFLKSQDYQEVKVFALKYEQKETENWKSRYASYLLTPQYLDSRNPLEQRQAARRLSQQLQDKYKFDLAIYTAHSHTTPYQERKTNPTALGNEALRLIKTVLAKRSFFNYMNLANIFLKQTEQLTYKQFKKSLLKYLIFSLECNGFVDSVKTQLSQKLELVYQHEEQQVLDKSLFLRTCNRVIEYLTIQKNGKPSDLFVLIASQGNPLTLAIMILKILLICPLSRTYLELCMAKLIEYYENDLSSECEWVINFLEVSKIILTIYTENVKYNLVNMEQENLSAHKKMIEQDSYRIFSQSNSDGK